MKRHSEPLKNENSNDAKKTKEKSEDRDLLQGSEDLDSSNGLSLNILDPRKDSEIAEGSTASDNDCGDQTDFSYNTDNSENYFDFYIPNFLSMDLVSAKELQNYQHEASNEFFQFDESNSGVKNINFQSPAQPLDYFELFITKDMVQGVIDATNQYAKAVLDDKYLHRRSFLRHWKPVTLDEMYVFISLTMSIEDLFDFFPTEYEDSFSELVDKFDNTPKILIMGMKRYKSILKMLKFGLGEQRHSNDMLSRLKSFAENLRSKFKKYYYPYEKLIVVDSRDMFDGNVSRKRIIESHDYEVRMCILYDTLTSYVLDFDVFCNLKDVHYPCRDLSSEEVLPLIEDYYNKGHSLCIENWKPCPELFQHLKNKMMNACIFIKNYPLSVCFKWKRFKQTIVSLRKDVQVGARWEAPLSLKPIRKLDGDDANPKWYKQVAFRLFNLALLNAKICYSETEKKSSRYKRFVNIVCAQLVNKYSKCACGCLEYSRPCRLKGGNHFLNRIKHPYITFKLNFRQKHKSSKLKKKRTVHWTVKRKYVSGFCYTCKTTQLKRQRLRRSIFKCKVCNLFFCIRCFENFHIALEY